METTVTLSGDCNAWEVMEITRFQVGIRLGPYVLLDTMLGDFEWVRGYNGTNCYRTLQLGDEEVEPCSEGDSITDSNAASLGPM